MTSKTKKVLLSAVIALGAFAGAVGTTRAAMMDNFSGFDQLIQMVQNRNSQNSEEESFYFPNNNGNSGENANFETACNNVVTALNTMSGKYQEVNSQLNQDPEQYTQALNTAMQYMQQSGDVDQQDIESLQELQASLPALLEGADALANQWQSVSFDCSNPDFTQVMPLMEQFINIANTLPNSGQGDVDPSNMSPDEMEAWMEDMFAGFENKFAGMEDNFAGMESSFPQSSDSMPSQPGFPINYSGNSSNFGGNAQGTWSFFGNNGFGSLFGR